MSDVPRSLQSWVSTIQSVVLTADVFHFFYEKKVLKNVSCEYDRWVVEIQLCSCVVRETRSLGVLVLCFICNMVFVNYIYDMVVAQFHKFYGRPFARVLDVFLMKGVGRWLPWVLPGSTGRFYKDDDVHKTFCARILYNQHRGRGQICMLLLHVKQNKTKLSK